MIMIYVKNIYEAPAKHIILSSFINDTINLKEYNIKSIWQSNEKLQYYK